MSSEFVKIIEVGPRDGLQNEKEIILTADKVKFIELLAKSGLKNIEATSFVNPKAIPQMADAVDLWNKIQSIEGPKFSALVPNFKGYELAQKCKVEDICIFTATSDSFNKKNINTDIKGSFERIKPIVKKAIEEQRKVRVYISTAFGCPYEGKTSIKTLVEVIEEFLKLGSFEFSISDTIGAATPSLVSEVLKETKKILSLDQIALHFHDTRGMALVNILRSLESDIRIFDSSAGGLGGCPYAKGATGNVATEEVAYLVDSLGFKTGIDIDKLIIASSFMLEKVKRKSESKYLNAYLAKKS
jgi:hydroxymethylglutaryl-CoA lyase